MVNHACPGFDCSICGTNIPPNKCECHDCTQIRSCLLEKQIERIWTGYPKEEGIKKICQMIRFAEDKKHGE